jgi:hypothetical protein
VFNAETYPSTVRVRAVTSPAQPHSVSGSFFSSPPAVASFGVEPPGPRRVVLSKLLNSHITGQYLDNIDAISEEFFKKEIHPQWAVARRMEFASTRITVLQNNLKGQILSFVQTHFPIVFEVRYRAALV